ncbi:hypothetical protein EYE40_00595 [Glaciihabitans arcticus]|uniref:Uncharacterized protein n=1 Tax=Glaciihabitans arcticus TaxID=2668039 RepID=A0A4Q9GPZ3_9MICO|nr:hypothetical protein [Glaciihabitans arcticus]TBN56014.1 hypothetical protein EYE40_00595 [Glaciihabitans arcticus]
MISRLLVSLVLSGALLMTGCSPLPQPPAQSVAAAREFEAEIRALPGVTKVVAEVDAVDEKDRPGEFYLRLVVTAARADDLATLPDLIAAVPSPTGLRLSSTLFVPKGPGVAAVTLENSREVERAAVLRALPMVDSVRMDPTSDSVQVASEIRVASAVAALRESGTLTSDPFDAVSVSWEGFDLNVSVSAAGPSDALIDYLEEARPRVDRISSVEPREQSPRPHLTVNASSPGVIARSLAALTGDETPGRPRTVFFVHSDTESITGYVGLPLGSAEPDDLALFEPTPAPIDEVARAAQVAADTELLTQFLLNSAEASGVPGTPEVFVGECSTGADGVQVQGTLLLPVFEYADSAEPAYKAVTRFWKASGLEHTEQATGTSIYSPSTVQRIEQATIRGTTEGVRITAMTTCLEQGK